MQIQMRYLKIGFASAVAAILFSAAPAQSKPINVIYDDVSPLGAFPTQHAASLIETSSDHLLACFWAGTAEGANDVRIYCSEWTASTAWQPLTAMISAQTPVDGNSGANAKIGNVALGKDGQGQIWMFNSSVRKPWSGWSAASIDYRLVQTKQGLSLGATHELLGGFSHMGSMVRSSALTTAQGDLLLPYYSDLSNNSGLMWIQADGSGRSLYPIANPSGSKGVIEPEFVFHGGDVLVYLRDKDEIATRTARFSMQTRQWSAVESTNVENSNSPSAALELKNGMILLLTNPSRQRPRYPLSLMCSDDGKKFWAAVEIEGPQHQSPAEDYAYPALVKTASGQIHGIYSAHEKKSIRHFHVSETEVVEACRVTRPPSERR